MVDVKICGISSPADYQACRAAGARWIGMVYYPGSPRHLDIKALASLADQIETLPSAGPQRVLLTVDQTLASLRALIAAARPDFLQFHGQETVSSAIAIKAEFGLPIIKMIPLKPVQIWQLVRNGTALLIGLFLTQKLLKGHNPAALAIVLTGQFYRIIRDPHHGCWQAG